MSWISTLSYAASSGKLRTLFDRVRRPDGYMDNILLVHGLRPHTLEGHMMRTERVEINQVVSYFAYANRTVLGLGVSLEGDVLGLSPNDSSDAENWRHS